MTIQTRKKVEKSFHKDYFITDISIRTNGYIDMILKKAQEDPLEFTNFSILSCSYSKDIWLYQHNAFHTWYLNADYAITPKGEYVVLMSNGEVHVLSKPAHPEKNIPAIPPMIDGGPFFAKTLSNGKIYTVSYNRIVMRRDAPDKWTHLSAGLPSVKESIKESEKTNRSIGFFTIDDFSENDIYAGGGDGDLWHWNGKKWTMIDIPFNSYIDHIICGDDGQVYISTNDGIIIGNNNTWEFADISDELDIIVETMVWYKDRLYIATATQLYQIKDNHFSLSKLDGHKNRPYYWRTLAVGAGVMVAGYLDSVVVYDGKELTKILTLPNDI